MGKTYTQRPQTQQIGTFIGFYGILLKEAFDADRINAPADDKESPVYCVDSNNVVLWKGNEIVKDWKRRETGSSDYTLLVDIFYKFKVLDRWVWRL